MNIDILGGGTVSYVRNHLALTAPAYGKTANRINSLCWEKLSHNYDGEINLHLTKMANGGKSSLETNNDVEKLVDQLIANPQTKIIFFNVALVDFDGSIENIEVHDYDFYPVPTPSGKYETRLKTSEGRRKMALTPAKKIISKIRKERKDIFLVGFKTTCGATHDEQF